MCCRSDADFCEWLSLALPWRATAVRAPSASLRAGYADGAQEPSQPVTENVETSGAAFSRPWRLADCDVRLSAARWNAKLDLDSQTAEKCPDNRRRGRLQPPDESDHLSGFSRGLIPCSFDTHRGTRFLSHSAVCVALINFDNTNGQTGAEALNLCQSIGRLKPPASTVTPTFFSGLFSPGLCPMLT